MGHTLEIKLLGQILGEIVKLVHVMCCCLLFCALHSSMNPYMVAVCRVDVCISIYSLPCMYRTLLSCIIYIAREYPPYN